MGKEARNPAIRCVTIPFFTGFGVGFKDTEPNFDGWTTSKPDDTFWYGYPAQLGNDVGIVFAASDSWARRLVVMPAGATGSVEGEGIRCLFVRLGDIDTLPVATRENAAMKTLLDWLEKDGPEVYERYRYEDV